MIKLILIVILEITILYFGVRFLYLYYKEDKNIDDTRYCELSKRLYEIERRLKKIEGTNNLKK